MNDNDDAPPTCGPSCDCAPTANLLPRRSFVALTGLALAGAAIAARPAMAGPFAPSDFEQLIPADKKLHPDWVRSLYARGEPAVYTKKKNELHFIGMPVGGICAGTLYLGGDGRLWVWDIFNQNRNGILPHVITADIFGVNRQLSAQDGSGYVRPHEQESPLSQGFAIKVGGVVRNLDGSGWEDVSFEGRYPMGTVRYADPASPVSVAMTAYSPFIPLNVADSSLPATVCEITIKNIHSAAVDVEVGGWLENAVRLYSAQAGVGTRTNTHRTGPNGATIVRCEFDGAPHVAPEPARPDIPLDSFQQGTYGLWKATGTAFGTGPVARENVPAYQGPLGGEGKFVVNTHAAAPADNVGARDAATGTLTSPEFTIDRLYITFNIGGGANIEQVGLRLIIDGKTVRRAGGRDENPMHRAVFDVSPYVGKLATLEAYDRATGPWGHVGFSQVVLTDRPGEEVLDAKSGDSGSMAIALLERGVTKASVTPATVFDALESAAARKPTGDPLIGAITKALHLAPGASKTLTFVVAWYFPNTKLPVKDATLGNEYAARFKDAAAVAQYVATNHARLSRDTHLWTDTWYDSTLPHWFLDRTFANTSILATTTAHRFANGRFWAWEGVGCCEGTCTHVWHYAQAVGRIFPELERHTREFVDFGVALDPATGKIGYRGENTGPAVDGQAGRILGAYREHQMSADGAFLRRIWPRVRAAMQFLIHHDANDDGLLDGPQENTLDAAWFGKIAWLSSLYAAALRASEEMATEVGDTEFAAVCHSKFAKTKSAIETQLFTGEYFVQLPEPGREKSLGTYQTCHIDQVHGQSWAWQVSLGRIFDRERTLSALRALYKYNFTPDVAPFRRKYTAGRPYALAGDGGLIMATNPKDLPHPFGNSSDWQYGYFNECMSGFEHQAASHMIAEGLIEEGLAVTRAIHDRYHPSRRNPYNEIECSDHYSRAMASYGSFLTACGFEYHGPAGHIGFAPRLSPDDFKAAFTAAEGWGSYSQVRERGELRATIAVKWGRLRVKSFALMHTAERKPALVKATIDGRPIAASVAPAADGRWLVTLAAEAAVVAGQRLEVVA